MRQHWNRQLEELNETIAVQATAVEESVKNAIRAVVEKKPDLAVAIIKGDDIIDENEVRIEEECLKALALYQPVAGDLRYVITLLKVNTELERIGDLATNVARRAKNLADHELALLVPGRDIPDFTPMYQEVLRCLKKALDAFFRRDCLVASEVIAADDAIDRCHHNNIDRIAVILRDRPDLADTLLHFLTISRNLERIADSCTNIGEDVLYLEQGIIVRHQRS